MKTLFLTTVAGALLVSGGGVAAESIQASADQANTKVQTYQMNSDNHHASGDLQQYTEYNMLNKHVENVEDYQAKVVANNPHKRVIILIDDNNKEQYKSIFIKKTDRLKIIDFDNGLVFNQVLTESDKPEADDEDDASEDENESSDNDSGDADDFPEFDTLENEVNADDDQVRIAEDNQHKRVMFVQGEDSQKQFKSIFIKDTNRLKIIDLNNGQVFNQVLTDSDKPETDDEDDASEDENESSDNDSGDADDFPEFDTLENEVNADDDQVRIAEDNQHKRVMFVQGEDSQKQFKSIFIKDTNRLKIIDLNNGQVFNQVLTDSDKPETDDEDDSSEDENESSDNDSGDADDFPEFDTLENEVNADDDQVRIAEDNQHKRVMFVQSEDNQKQFKSIFIKDTNRLKIIDLDNGQVFNQIIK